MKFGYFDDLKREYVITQPDTPLPWINYLGCQAYFGIISNTAGGYSFYRDARLRRITRYRYNNAPFDVGGRYIYVRDNDSKEFWSPSWQPTRHKLQNYSCRHGMGYSIIGSEYKEIEACTRYFVPLDDNLEIWQLTITNRRQRATSMSIFGGVEFCLWDAQDDSANFQRNFSIGQVEVEDSVIYHKTEYRERRDHFAYFACSEKLTGFDTQRETFLDPWHQVAAMDATRGHQTPDPAPDIPRHVRHVDHRDGQGASQRAQRRTAHAQLRQAELAEHQADGRHDAHGLPHQSGNQRDTCLADAVEVRRQGHLLRHQVTPSIDKGDKGRGRYSSAFIFFTLCASDNDPVC